MANKFSIMAPMLSGEERRKERNRRYAQMSRDRHKAEFEALALHNKRLEVHLEVLNEHLDFLESENSKKDDQIRRMSEQQEAFAAKIAQLEKTMTEMKGILMQNEAIEEVYSSLFHFNF